jgi:hypothetical protein
MKIGEIQNLLHVRSHNTKWMIIGSIGGGIACAFLSPTVILGGLCAGVVIGYTSGKQLSNMNIDDRIRDLGCSCVL